MRDSASLRQQGDRARRIVHPHRGSRPQGQPAHRHRRLRHQRLLAGDLPRLLRVAAVRHHQQPYSRQQVRQRRAGRRRLCPEQRLRPDRRQRVQEQFLRPRRRGFPERHRRKPNTVAIERNLIDGNAGTEPGASHGGALYVFGKTLRITGNLFTRNTVTQWGARPLCRRLDRRRTFHDREPELERLSRQPRRQRRRRHVLRRRRDLHRAITRSTTGTAAATSISTAAATARARRPRDSIT